MKNETNNAKQKETSEEPKLAQSPAQQSKRPLPGAQAYHLNYR